MAWFSKKDKVIDLSKYRNKAPSRTPSTNKNQPSESSSGFALFDSQATDSSYKNTGEGDDFLDLSGGTSGSSFEIPESRKKKLAKRILDMTTQLENLSNQIYHLQQRVEVLERKLDVNRYS